MLPAMMAALHPSEKPRLVTSTGVERLDGNILLTFQMVENGRVIVLAMPELEAFWLAQELTELT